MSGVFEGAVDRRFGHAVPLDELATEHLPAGFRV